MGDSFSIEDALIILRRRFLYFLGPFIAISIVAAAIVMVLPAMYTAQGTILVESQQIPEELVRSTINEYAQERIQTIEQRVMTRSLMLEVADDLALFPKSRGLTETERVNIMRDRLKVKLITAARDRRSASDGTIAFTVAYTDPRPQKAFRVANRFMTLFLDEDVRSRTTGASNTTEFFDQQATRLRNNVSQLEERISTYKSENADALPEHLDMHLDMLERARRDFDTAESTISQLEEEKRFLETQLISGPTGDSDVSQQLAQLEAELARLRATYRDNYPEIVAKRDEIAVLKRSIAPSREITNLRDALNEADDELARLELESPVDEAAIAAAESKVDAARLALSQKISEESRRGATDAAGFQLEGRIAIINNRIRMLRRQSDSAAEEIKSLQSRVANTPNVERGLSALTRDYENIFREYQEVLAKQQDAILAENLEENQQAEKFSILEPALRPDAPSSPDRPKLIVLGVFLAGLAGAAAAFVAEMMFQVLRGRSHISAILDGPPIAVIPYIELPEEKGFRILPRPRKKSAGLAAANETL